MWDIWVRVRTTLHKFVWFLMILLNGIPIFLVLFLYFHFDLGWASGVTNNASYPVLFISYVHNQFFSNVPKDEHNVFLHYGILASITVVLAFVNYRGLHVVGKASIVIFFVSMTPFVIMVIMGIPKGESSVSVCLAIYKDRCMLTRCTVTPLYS